MNELKHCPFCGGEASTYTCKTDKKGLRSIKWLVHCEKCGVNYPAIKDCYNEHEAIEAWNTRAVGVKEGEWRWEWVAKNGVAEKKAVCSICGVPNKQYMPPYCPHCGSKMEKERFDENAPRLN